LKIVVCGGQDFTDYPFLCETLDKYIQTHAQGRKVIIIEGEARGADLLAKKYAKERGLEWLPYPAAWTKLGLGAGMIRNREMWRDGDRGVAFWDGRSPGTRDSIACARRLRKPVEIFYYRE